MTMTYRKCPNTHLARRFTVLILFGHIYWLAVHAKLPLAFRSYCF